MQQPQAVSVLPPEAVNVPRQVDKTEGKKSKKWTKAQTNMVAAMRKITRKASARPSSPRP